MNLHRNQEQKSVAVCRSLQSNRHQRNRSCLRSQSPDLGEWPSGTDLPGNDTRQDRLAPEILYSEQAIVKTY